MQTIGIRLIIITTLCAVFVVGMVFLGALVSERQYYHQGVIDEIKSSYVGEQVVVTPFLVSSSADGTNYIFAHSSQIDAHADVRDDEYRRGIYQAVSYRTKLTVQQRFEPQSATIHTHYVQPSSKSDDEAHIHKPIDQGDQTTSAAPNATLKLIIAISDLRGVIPSDVTINGQSYPATFGTDKAFALPHLQVKLPITEQEFLAGEPLEVHFTLAVAGIGAFGVMPAGNDVRVTLMSNWQTPKFTGISLPSQKSFVNDGFHASWYSTLHGQQNQQALMDIQAGTMENFEQYAHLALMSEFVQASDTYTLTNRSIKYGLLIVMVSFATFFLLEVIRGLSIHPVQYLLVASALLVFYLLLLSLAEQTAFLYAYLIASIACVSLIGWYACYMLASVKRGVGFGVVLASLYAAFYVILSASEHNLLLGSVFCFVFIAVVMVVTRRVNWYATSHPFKPAATHPSTTTQGVQHD